MAGAIAARIQGDDYQARVFWREACRLFEVQSRVVCVGFEHNNVKSFDDVAVFYNGHMRDEDDNPLHTDYFQVKFHVNAAGALTGEALITPNFINATSVSLLERLRNAQQQYAPQGVGVRFFLYSPWSIDPTDPLAQIYSQRNGRLQWAKLAQAGPKSRLGKLRTAWRDHLQLANDDALRLVLQPLRIKVGPTLHQLQETLNDKLQLAGFTPVDVMALTNPYDDVFRKLLQAGRTSFTRADIEAIGKRERLWRGRPFAPSPAKRLGVRSFVWRTEHLPDETDAMVCLVHHFDGRYIRAAERWEQQIYPELAAFLTEALPAPQQAHLELHTHGAIAFAAGYCLNSKSGIECVLVQHTNGKRSLWCPDVDALADTKAYPGWRWSTEILPSAGSDVALVLSVTHPNLPDVLAFVERSLPSVRRVITGTLPSGTRTTAIQDGTHARILAEEISAYVKVERTQDERNGVLHIFAAAPNGLLFFLGQLAHSFGRCVVYEYDFERNAHGAYTATLSFPPKKHRDIYTSDQH